MYVSLHTKNNNKIYDESTLWHNPVGNLVTGKNIKSIHQVTPKDMIFKIQCC